MKSAVTEIREIIFRHDISPSELIVYLHDMSYQRLSWILTESKKIDHDVYTDFMRAFSKMGIDVEKKTPGLTLVGRCNRIIQKVAFLESEIIDATEDGVIDQEEIRQITRNISDIRRRLDELEEKIGKGETKE